MKRRKFLALTSLGGVGIAIGIHKYLTNRYPLTLKSCPNIVSATSSPLLRFAAVGDVGTGENGQYNVAKAMSCFFAANPFPHNIYSSGKYGFNSQLRDKLAPLFSLYRVQLYINGHEHHYERTNSIKGTTYVTCGNGAKLRSVGKSEWSAYSVSRLGFAAVEVYSDRLEVMGIGTNGKIFDRGEILLG